MNATLILAAVVVGMVCLVGLFLAAAVAVQAIRDRLADRFTAREVARGAVEVYPVTPRRRDETAVDRALREAYEGKRPIRRVTR